VPEIVLGLEVRMASKTDKDLALQQLAFWWREIISKQLTNKII